ncbi:hypothetical protein D3C84_956010 [compost metagenome]
MRRTDQVLLLSCIPLLVSQFGEVSSEGDDHSTVLAGEHHVRFKVDIQVLATQPLPLSKVL